jgi:hypothetical protein
VKKQEQKTKIKSKNQEQKTKIKSKKQKSRARAYFFRWYKISGFDD